MRIEIPLVGGHYKSSVPKIDAQECINLYPVIDQSGGRELSLHPVPGLKKWVDTGSTSETRALYKFSDNILYAVVGNEVYKIDRSGNYSSFDSQLNTDSGRCQFVTNGVQIMMLDLSSGVSYVIENDELTQITDSDLPFASSLTYQDGYAVISKAGSRKFYVSTLDIDSLAAYEASDFTKWDSLEYGRVEGLHGNIKSILSDHNELLILGSEQMGFYYNSGNADFPFTMSENPFQTVGLGGSPASIVQLDNSVLWIDDWNNVRKLDGYTPIIVSTPEVSSMIEQYNIDDAFAFGYRHSGHSFYCITFPSSDKTYCYDIATGVWHMRSSGMNGGRWRANCYVKFGGKHLVGDYKSGVIFEMDTNKFTENERIYPATRVTKYIDDQRRMVFYSRLELHMLTGSAEISKDPQVMLQWSDNGGESWSNEKWANIGKIGQYTARVVWRKLGRSRERIFRFRITDPINRVLIALYADVITGRD